MASSFSATYPAPDPIDFAAGQTVKEEATAAANDVNLQTLRNASNYLGARLRAQPVVSQGWYNSFFQHTSTAGVFGLRCRWRIPQISSSHTTVWCAVRASVTGAGCNVRFKGVNSAVSRDIAIPVTGAAWFTIATALPVLFNVGANDYEEIEFSTAADATAVLTIHEVSVWYADLASPLTAGRYTVSGWAWDTIDDDEVAHKESYNAYLARKFGNNIEGFAARPRTYASWSSVADGPGLVLVNTAITRMTTVAHSWLAVPNDQEDILTRWIKYYVRMGDPASLVATDLYIAAGEMPDAFGDILLDLWFTKLSTPAIDGTNWKSGSLTWHLVDADGPFGRRAPGPFRVARISADTRIAAAATARHIYSMSFWGV